MQKFNEIILLPNEHKLLKQFNKKNEITISDITVKTLRINGFIQVDDLSTLNKRNPIGNYHITDKGKRFLLWSKKNFIKSYFPILISFTALAISMVHIFLQILGVI